jgi:hypothetical protein
MVVDNTPVYRQPVGHSLYVAFWQIAFFPALVYWLIHDAFSNSGYTPQLHEKHE